MFEHLEADFNAGIFFNSDFKINQNARPGEYGAVLCLSIVIMRFKRGIDKPIVMMHLLKKVKPRGGYEIQSPFA
jgi:hypothetical protein